MLFISFRDSASRLLCSQVLHQKLPFAFSCLLPTSFYILNFHNFKLSQHILALHLSNSFSTFNCPLDLHLIDLSDNSKRIYSFLFFYLFWREIVTKPFVFIPQNGYQVAHLNVHFLLTILLNINNWGKFGNCSCC